jgi:AhpD family alkylhydroperoxidase
MTTEEHKLSPGQKELVAVGASVGAGCQPCVSHHLEAGADAGLEGEQLLAAATSAERVAAEAAVAMADHVRGTLGPHVTSPALLSRLEEALASLGAAVGANDLTNIERQLRAVAELGAVRSQLQEAIETAHTVQENAARIHRRKAERLLDAVAPAVAADRETQSDEGCGCGADEESEPAPRGAETPQLVGTTSGSGCRSMAARFGAAGGFGAMADCRELFERFVPAVAPGERNQAPTATAPAGSCKKED